MLINICLHKWLIRLEAMSTSEITVTLADTPESVDRLRRELDDRKISVTAFHLKKTGDGKANIVITARIAKNAVLNDMLDFFKNNKDIFEYSIDV
ncbi:MAG: hypothetical protein MJ078_00035 [Clostridia bacterium]|nr:hypothetical protein [Clostridia bacterium]